MVIFVSILALITTQLYVMQHKAQALSGSVFRVG